MSVRDDPNWTWPPGLLETDAGVILERLAEGDIAGLEDAEAILDGFPDGMDEVFQRYWITNAIDIGTVSAVEWMIGRGVTLNFRDDEGYTVLHSAINREKPGKHDILAMLIAAGADVNSRGLNDWTPLHLAAVREDRKVIAMLLEAGADPGLKTSIDDYATPAEEARILG